MIIHSKKCTFLDIELTIKRDIIITNLYNKTDDFNFNVIKCIHANSNIN